MRELGTGSEMQRVVACPGSAVLPRVDTESDEAAHGQVVHDFLAAVPTAGRDAALEAVPLEHRAALEGIPVGSLPLDAKRFKAEVAYAYNLDTERARFLGQHLKRRYTTEPNEVPITLDVAGVDGELALVADYKSGWGHVPPAPENLQIGLGVLVVADVEGLQEGRGAIIRVRDTGEPWYDEAEFSPFELEVVREQLREARAKVREQRARFEAGKTVNVTTGKHCRYCPAKLHCPAFQQTLATMATRPDDLVQELRSMLTPELAARAYRNFKFAKEALQVIELALRGFAADHPIPLEDGKVYGYEERTEKSFDARTVFEVLSSGYGIEAAKAGVEFEASNASIERGIRAWRDAKALAEPGRKAPSMAPEVRKVVDQVHQLGGITERPKVTMREHTPKPVEPPVLEAPSPEAATP